MPDEGRICKKLFFLVFDFFLRKDFINIFKTLCVMIYNYTKRAVPTLEGLRVVYYLD